MCDCENHSGGAGALSELILTVGGPPVRQYILRRELMWGEGEGDIHGCWPAGFT